MTQNFQPTININVPVAGPSKDSSEASGSGSAERNEPTNINFKFLLHMAVVGDRWYQGNTRGGGSQIEGFELDLSGIYPGLGCEYMVRLASLGDSEWTSDGNFAGTRGQSRGLEGLAVRLTGPASHLYSVWYSGKCATRAHVGLGYVELAPASDGQFLGTRGLFSPLTELEVHIVRRTCSDVTTPRAPSFLFVFGVPLGENDSPVWVMMLKHYGPDQAYNCDTEFIDEDRKNIEHQWLVAHPGSSFLPPGGVAGESQKRIHVAEAGPSGAGDFRWEPLDPNTQHYSVNIICRDGMFVEKWEVTRVDGALRSKLVIERGPEWIKRHPTSEPGVFRYVDPEFVSTALAVKTPAKKRKPVNPG